MTWQKNERPERGDLIISVSGTDCIIAYVAVTGWTNDSNQNPMDELIM